MIYTFEHIQKNMELEADLCVIGSGAGGAPVAFEAAKAGKKVILLEGGRFWRPKDFTQLEHEMFPKLYQDKGSRTSYDKAVHIHQGKGVGGSTLHNLNLCARVPKQIEHRWRKQQGLKQLTEKTLDALYTEVEQRLSVTTLDASQMSSNNRLLKKGVEALGYKGGYLKHNRVGCVSSGFCEVGCAFDAKQNALKMYVAPAVEKGLMVLSDTWGAQMFMTGRKVTSLWAYTRDPKTLEPKHRIRIKAKAYCVSASATGTPALLQRSGVPDPHGLVGSRLFIHPAVAVAGIFDEVLNGWQGIPQSYECTEFLDFSEGSQKRAWIIPAFAHPVGVSSILSGFGDEHLEYFQHYHKMAAFTAMLHDETVGSVRKDGKFGVKIHYWPNESDQKQLLLGLKECAKLMLAAGAKKAIIPFSKTMELTSSGAVEKQLKDAQIKKFDINITAVHPMGSVWMGDDAKTSCVDATGRYHHLDNLYVADTSLFPSSIGGPPQLTTYTLGTHVGRQLLKTL